MIKDRWGTGGQEIHAMSLDMALDGVFTLHTRGDTMNGKFRS